MARILILPSVADQARIRVGEKNPIPFPEDIKNTFPPLPKAFHQDFKARLAEAENRKVEREKKLKLAAQSAQIQKVSVSENQTSSSKPGKSRPAHIPSERKDAPPYKALSSILNLPRIFSTPHTADQISALWTTYHASRSDGTGRGYVCASIPLNLYEKMQKTGLQYPTFVVPIPRIQLEPTPGQSPEENLAHEFFFLQWDFHARPPVPSPSDDPFVVSMPASTSGTNPQSSTVLFTPLAEYKMRGSFATPYLVLTMYTDLAATHGVVLLRGEITPSTASVPGSDRYMLNQADTQLLTMALQKFYLWGEGQASGQLPSQEGERLVRNFHEKPQDFKWEDLLKFSNITL
ncbi:ATP11 protein-domain-containing protein [Crassisporium funariophilum]|nr:ATP11 protein-domain-containing protein [Crassisporium funariophilum]